MLFPAACAHPAAKIANQTSALMVLSFYRIAGSSFTAEGGKTPRKLKQLQHELVLSRW
jgi:hypothetical protein